MFVLQINIGQTKDLSLFFARDECRELSLPSDYWHHPGVNQQEHGQCHQGQGNHGNCRSFEA